MNNNDAEKCLYYADNNDTYGILFQLYKSSDVDNTYHPSIVSKWKANIKKEFYKEKQYLGVYIPSENRE